MGGCMHLCIEDLTERHIPALMGISKKEFGSDYLSEREFLDCISDEDVFCRVAVLEGEPVGFCICRLFGPEDADEELKLPDSDERDMMMSFGRIGLIDAITLREDMQGRGYGTVLAQDCYTRLAAGGAECICAMAWRSIRGTTNAKRLLENLGLKESIAIQGYWNLMVDSPEGHHCPHCGPPCRCYGVLYWRRV